MVLLMNRSALLPTGKRKGVFVFFYLSFIVQETLLEVVVFTF